MRVGVLIPCAPLLLAVQVYDPQPLPKESASWSGPCVDGIASGDGILTWFITGQPVSHFKGPLVQGRPDSTGAYTYANGDRYEGEFYQGSYDGRGAYTLANGAKYAGDFVHGTIRRWISIVIGFTSAEVFESLTPVRLSTMARFDNAAETELKIRALGGNWLDGLDGLDGKDGSIVAGTPLAGCHMVGHSFAPGEHGITINRGPGD